MVVSTSIRTLSTVGMCVNGSFLGICIWRLIRTLQAMDNLKERRVRLHITLFVFALFEFLFQVSIFATDEYVDFHLYAEQFTLSNTNNYQ